MTQPSESTAILPESSWRARLAQNGWAVADQGLFAGANFLLNILLARWLDPATYGAFAVGLTVLFLLGSMHVSLLGEPLLVFGAARFADRRRAYLGAVMAGHWIVAIAAMALMGVAAAIAMTVGARQVAVALAGLGLCSPFILLLWLARRICYLTQRPRGAAVAGTAYLVLMVASLALLHWRRSVTLPAALAVMGICNAIVGVALILLLRPDYRAVNRPLLREVAAAHLRYGRWSAATNLTIILSGHALLVIAAGMTGLEAGATLRAMINLIAPMQLVSAAVATLLVPALVRTAAEELAGQSIRRPLLVLTAAATVYWAALALAQGPLLKLIYRNQYHPPAHLLWILGATLLSGTIADVVAAALRAAERPDLVFKAFSMSAVVGIVGGTILITTRGLTGAVLAMAVASVIATAGLVLFLGKMGRRVGTDTAVAAVPTEIRS